jgi:hypothetical protein
VVAHLAVEKVEVRALFDVERRGPRRGTTQYALTNPRVEDPAIQVGLEKHQLVSTAGQHKEVFGAADALEAGPDMVQVDNLVVLPAGNQDGFGIRGGGLIRLVVEDGVVTLEPVRPNIERVSQLLGQQIWVLLISGSEVDEPA